MLALSSSDPANGLEHHRSHGLSVKDRLPNVNVASLKRVARHVQAAFDQAVATPIPEADPDALGEESEDVSAHAARSDPVGSNSSWQNLDDAATADSDFVQVEGSEHLVHQSEMQEGKEDDEAMCVSRDKACGRWVSTKGKCRIFHDKMTNQLSYEELMKDSCRLHGFLVRKPVAGELEAGADSCAEVDSLWEAQLAVLESDERPWYGPSFGEEPEFVGAIQVRYRHSADQLLTQIRVADEDADWQPETEFRRQPTLVRPSSTVEDGGMFVFGAEGQHGDWE